MPVTPELVQYVTSARASGLSDDAIRAELLKAGWNVEDVNATVPPRTPNFPPPAALPTASAPSLQAALPVQSKRRRSHLGFIVTVVVLLAVGGATYYFLPQIVGFYERVAEAVRPGTASPPEAGVALAYAQLQDALKGLPPVELQSVQSKPINLVLTATDTSAYATTSISGFEFKTPWGKGTESGQTKNATLTKQVSFPNGNQMIVTCATGTPRQELQSMNLPGIDEVLSYLGTEVDSGYEYENALLSATPADVRDATSTAVANALAKLVVLKTTTLFSPSQPYRFSTENIRGFQFGDLSSASSTMQVMVFPESGAMAGESCTLGTPLTDHVTQADINAILSTFMVVPSGSGDVSAVAKPLSGSGSVSSGSCTDNDLNCLVDAASLCTPTSLLDVSEGLSTRYAILGIVAGMCHYQELYLGGTVTLDQALVNQVLKSGTTQAEINQFTQFLQSNSDMTKGKTLDCHAPTASLASYVKSRVQDIQKFEQTGDMSFDTNSSSSVFIQTYCQLQ